MEEHHHHERRHGLLLAVGLAAIGLGLAVGGYFIGNMMYKSKVATNTATVKGLAEREVKADTGIWDVSFDINAATLPEAYSAANATQEKVTAFLSKAGFADTELTPHAFSVNKQDVRDNNNKLIETSYNIIGTVSVRSADVEKIAQAARATGDLVGQGVILVNSSPQYLFTKLNDIKPEMLGEATRNARVAAEQFAKDANAKVGGIYSAEQGAFNFSARDSAGEDNGGESMSIDKKVRVVTTISFYLKD